MAYQPAGSLANRTFIGLIVAQFLAGFNDQAIHALSMFYAIHQGILTEAQAISLMPILFYAPWAIFCTISGYLADRYSKTYALITWKVAEIFIALVVCLGFYRGTVLLHPSGAWIVLGAVFLMGTHAAFFAPAKYGAMPEILQAHVLSRGNGILESTTFLASILGTVGGGLLSYYLRGHEMWIGALLLVLSFIGAAASLLIVYLPASNPSRLFPRNLFKPLWDNLRVLLGSKPLALSVIGIAFFVFMVSYMRSTLYMHGQTRFWTELTTSEIVATVALGVGLGCPLAGYFSGGKVELGLVPLGCVGMIVATCLASVAINHVYTLIAALVGIGFFSGFYMVPLYTLLQHRAPKATKGDLIATSNFINVTGAIAASILFFLLVKFCQVSGITPAMVQTDHVSTGTLVELKKDEHARPIEMTIKRENGAVKTYRKQNVGMVLVELSEAGVDFTPPELAAAAAVGMSATPAGMNVFNGVPPLFSDVLKPRAVIDFDNDLVEIFGSGIQVGDPVIVSKYTLHGINHFALRAASQSLRPVFDNEGLPRYLFLGAGIMTIGILGLLCWLLPDFFARTLFWLRSLGRFQLRGVRASHLPTAGPAILATNCDDLEKSLQLMAVMDRSSTMVLLEDPRHQETRYLHTLANMSGMMELPAASSNLWQDAETKAQKALRLGEVLALPVDGRLPATEVLKIFEHVQREAPILPVFCGTLPAAGQAPRARVVFGEPLDPSVSIEEVRRKIHELGEWIKENDQESEITEH